MGAYGPGIAWPQHPIHAWAGADALFQWNMLPAAFTKLYIPLQKWAWPGAANRLPAAGTLDVLTTTELFLQFIEDMCSTLKHANANANSEEGHDVLEVWCRAPVHLVALSTQLLQDPAVVGPAGLAAKPAAWLPPGQQLVKGWCTRLANRVCQMADRAGLVDVPHCGFVMSSEMHVLSALVDHVPMQPAAERALALLLVTLGFAMPLITVLKLVGEDDIRPDSQLAAALEELRVLLSQVPAHQVQGWLEAVDGTCGEAILNHALVAAALKLQLPHLTAPATKESVRVETGNAAGKQYVDRLEAAASWAWKQVQATSNASASEEERCKAQQLCSLLLTDPEMLDVLLALHDIRAAQLAGLNLSLRLAAAQALQARQQCMAQSLLLAASHPQWEAQRAEAVCNLLTLVEALSRDVELGDYTGKDISPVFILDKQHAGQPQLWLHNLLGSPMTTGWPGPLPAARTKGTAQPSAQGAGGGNSSRQGSGSTGAQLDLRVVNSYAHICHALSSLVLQQPQPLERMRLFSTTTPAPDRECLFAALRYF
ncbi:hypothetical protein V8C86DRAFT_3106408 [Haematococcus lacustris]